MVLANPKVTLLGYRPVIYLGGGMALGVKGIESFPGERLGIERVWEAPSSDRPAPERLINVLRGQELEHGKRIDVILEPREAVSVDDIICITAHWERLEWMPLYLNAENNNAAMERVMLHGVRYEEDDDRKEELTAALRLERSRV